MPSLNFSFIDSVQGAPPCVVPILSKIARSLAFFSSASTGQRMQRLLLRARVPFQMLNTETETQLDIPHFARQHADAPVLACDTHRTHTHGHR
jgi:hypothetical protein